MVQGNRNWRDGERPRTPVPRPPSGVDPDDVSVTATEDDGRMTIRFSVGGPPEARYKRMQDLIGFAVSQMSGQHATPNEDNARKYIEQKYPVKPEHATTPEQPHGFTHYSDEDEFRQHLHDKHGYVQPSEQRADIVFLQRAHLARHQDVRLTPTYKVHDSSGFVSPQITDALTAHVNDHLQAQAKREEEALRALLRAEGVDPDDRTESWQDRARAVLVKFGTDHATILEEGARALRRERLAEALKAQDDEFGALTPEQRVNADAQWDTFDPTGMLEMSTREYRDEMDVRVIRCPYCRQTHEAAGPHPNYSGD